MLFMSLFFALLKIPEKTYLIDFLSVPSIFTF